MNTELELLKRIDERNYLTEREHREFYGIVEKALINAQDIKEENTRYKNLEEELGCPLEVVFKAINQDYIYFKYLANWVGRKVKVIKSIKLGIKGYYIEIIIDNMAFETVWLKDYKKTWWLKEDRSE